MQPDVYNSEAANREHFSHLTKRVNFLLTTLDEAASPEILIADPKLQKRFDDWLYSVSAIQAKLQSLEEVSEEEIQKLETEANLILQAVRNKSVQ